MSAAPRQEPLNSTCLKFEPYVHNFYHFEVVQYPEGFMANVYFQWCVESKI